MATVNFQVREQQIPRTNIKELIDVIAPNESEDSKLDAGKFIISTLTKLFTILTGGSGTGKTALATRLAESFGSAPTDAKLPFVPGEQIGNYVISNVSPTFIRLVTRVNTIIDLPADLIRGWIAAALDGRIKLDTGRDDFREPASGDQFLFRREKQRRSHSSLHAEERGENLRSRV